jgi:hypothetical protein
VNRPWFDGDAHALATANVRGECSAVQALQRTLADVDAMVAAQWEAAGPTLPRIAPARS